jgi:SAM-dependent methyltransferase
VPEVGENSAIWEQGWDWSREGEEWSDFWGGTDALWHGALLPRIHPFLPSGTILEIAPGHGRWTNYLKDSCERLIAVDLAERCIEHCRRRFAADSNIEYHVNDGRSLEMVADDSIDFAFSFDSLVHVGTDVLDAYLGQLAAKLRPDGVGFIHHSNIGGYGRSTALARRIPAKALPSLIRRGLVIDIVAWRDESVTAAWFAAACDRAGLACITQELVSWEHGLFMIDAFSIFTPRGSALERPVQVLRNPLFSHEAKRMRRLYAPTS